MIYINIWASFFQRYRLFADFWALLLCNSSRLSNNIVHVQDLWDIEKIQKQYFSRCKSNKKLYFIYILCFVRFHIISECWWILRGDFCIKSANRGLKSYLWKEIATIRWFICGTFLNFDSFEFIELYDSQNRSKSANFVCFVGLWRQIKI